MMDEKKAEETGQAEGKRSRFVPRKLDIFTLEYHDPNEPPCTNCGNNGDAAFLNTLWDRSDLQKYLSFDTWGGYQALCILSGFAPDSVFNEITDDGNLAFALSKPEFATPCSIGRESVFLPSLCPQRNAFERLRDIWESGHTEYEKHAPDFYIKWALSKNIRPVWLDWAIGKKLFTFESERPIATTERNTLLTIIAALCDYSKISYQERGAAAQIARLTEASGTPVSEDAISKAIKKIPYVIETRTK